MLPQDLATARIILDKFYPEHQFSEEEIRILALALSVIPENLESASGGNESRQTVDNNKLLRALRIDVRGKIRQGCRLRSPDHDVT